MTPTRGRTMRAAIFGGPGTIRVEDRPYPVVVEPTDAVVRVVLSCVCGTDISPYRGESAFENGPIGHVQIFKFDVEFTFFIVFAVGRYEGIFSMVKDIQ